MSPHNRSTEPMLVQMSPIGFARTCFAEKFGVPRQSMMIEKARGTIKLTKDPRFELAFRELTGFSHIWLVYLFHKVGDRPWRAMVDTPRIDQPGMVGVFATRSPHRPNPIGISAVKLESINFEPTDGIEIHVSGIDLLDGTPILDIKPYLPYADRIDNTNSGWVNGSIEKYQVAYSPKAVRQMMEIANAGNSYFGELLNEILEYDPRPTSQRRAKRINEDANHGCKFAFRLLGKDIHWSIHHGGIMVEDIRDITPTSPCDSLDPKTQKNS